MKKIIYILPGAFLLRFKKNESLLRKVRISGEILLG